MSLYKLGRIQKVVNLLQLVPLFLLCTSLVIDVCDEPLPQLLDVIDSNIDVHLLLGLLHEVILGQATIDDLLSDIVIVVIAISIIMIWWTSCAWLGHVVNRVKVLLKRPIRPAVID